ncbi:pYEATS domain-containing protein [Bosea thiooxidans]
MSALGEILSGLASIAWPGLFIGGVYYFRSQIKGLLQDFRAQIAAGAVFKWKDFEFRGPDLSKFDGRLGDSYQRESADRELFDKRHLSYRANKNLFLVHRVRPTGEIHAVNHLPTYDISIYLISHKNFGHTNDIQKVEYYLGEHFGKSRSEFGTKYVVRNGTDGFAVKVNAYGPTLCEARIKFHDGSETTMSRYLDFEGTPYRFRSQTNADDQRKLAAKIGD